MKILVDIPEDVVAQLIGEAKDRKLSFDQAATDAIISGMFEPK